MTFPIPFYWQSYVAEVRKAFNDRSEGQPQKVTLIKNKGRIVGLSPVHDYVHCAPELEHVNLFEWIRCYKREKLPRKQKKRDPVDEEAEHTDGEDVGLTSIDEYNISFQSMSEINEKAFKKGPIKPKTLYHFKKEHPLYEPMLCTLFLIMPSMFLTLLVPHYPGVIRVTENTTVAQCLQYSSLGEVDQISSRPSQCLGMMNSIVMSSMMMNSSR